MNYLAFSLILFTSILISTQSTLGNIDWVLEGRSCNLNGKIQYFDTKAQRNQMCAQAQLCIQQSQMSCECQKLMADLTLSTVLSKSLSRYLRADGLPESIRGKDLQLYAQIGSIKTRVADYQAKLSQIESETVNNKRCSSYLLSLKCRTGNKDSSCACRRDFYQQQIDDGVDEIIRKYSDVEGLYDDDIDLNATVSLSLNILGKCVATPQISDPCHIEDKASANLPECVLPEKKSLPASLFPPSTPLRVLKDIDRLSTLDKDPSRFTKDKIGNFLCKLAPGRIDADGTVYGKMVARPTSEIESLLQEHILSDRSSDHQEFIKKVQALKNHPCFNELQVKSHYCQSMKVGCSREFPLETESIKDRMRNEFQYSCLQSLCETRGKKGPAFYDYLNPFFQQVLNSTKSVRLQNVSSGTTFGQFCTNLVFEKAGAYVPGIDLKYPYLNCSEEKYKQESVDLIQGNIREESRDDLKCFDNYSFTSSPSTNSQKYSSELHTAVRCIGKYGATYSSLRHVLTISSRSEIREKLEADGCLALWDSFPEEIKKESLQLQEVFVEKVQDHLAEKYQIAPQNRGISWNTRAKDNFQNLARASISHFHKFNKKIRKMRDQTRLDRREQDGCGKPLSSKVVEAIDSSMPVIAGIGAGVALFVEAPLVVVPVAAMGVYMGVKATQNITDRSLREQQAISFINNSGIANSYSGAVNFHRCAQSSCAKDLMGCFGQLFDADKDEFIRKMWNRPSCESQRTVADVWDGVGVTGGLLGGVTLVAKLPTPTIDGVLRPIIRDTARSLGVTENFTEGVGTGIASAGEGISSTLANNALKNPVVKRIAQSVDGATIYDAGNTIGDGKHLTKWIHDGGEIPCLSSYAEYRDFYHQLKREPEKFAEIADRLGLATFTGMCKVPHNYSSDDILPDPSETKGLLSLSLQSYCGKSKRRPVDASTLGEHFSESEKMTQSFKALSTKLSRDIRDTWSDISRLQLQLESLKRSPAGELDDEEMSKLEKQILLKKKDFSEYKDNQSKLAEQIQFMENELELNQKLKTLKKKYLEKKELRAKWIAKVRRGEDSGGFIKSYTISRVESDMRKFKADFRRILDSIKRKRTAADIPLSEYILNGNVDDEFQASTDQ